MSATRIVELKEKVVRLERELELERTVARDYENLLSSLNGKLKKCEDKRRKVIWEEKEWDQKRKDRVLLFLFVQLWEELGFKE